MCVHKNITIKENSNIMHTTILTPKRHKSSKKYSSTIIKQKEGTGSIAGISIIPKVTPFITEWAHKEMFTCSVADIITMKNEIFLMTLK